ncbi:hypothetical protein GGR53DRAFT_430300 [Hypoxylon sp. FL1150]|nr:hypothetical protein GGR53DRAFT_430300 [Hypoxylon sp. FL1150]
MVAITRLHRTTRPPQEDDLIETSPAAIMQRLLQRYKRRAKRLFCRKKKEPAKQAEADEGFLLEDNQGQGVLNFLVGSDDEMPDFKSDKWKRARAAYLRAQKDFLHKYEERLKFERVMGMGGFGMAQLWTVRDEKGEYVRDVVIKMPMPEGNRATVNDSIRREITWMGQIFKNAEHITQLVYLTDIAKKNEYRIYNNPYVETPYLVMESLSRGTLMDLIENITASRYENMQNPDNRDEQKLGFCTNKSSLEDIQVLNPRNNRDGISTPSRPRRGLSRGSP